MSRISLTILLLAAAPLNAWSQAGAIKILSVVNAASFQPGMPSGGALATVFVSGLSLFPPNAGTFVAPPGAPLPYTLDDVQVFVNGALAPILAVVALAPGYLVPPQQINFQVPMERNSTAGSYPDTGTLSIVQHMALSSDTYTPLPQEGLGGFFSDANGYAIAQHASDFTPVTVQNPAHPGEAIVVYADDFFQTWPPPPIAIPTPAQPLFTSAPIGYERYFAGGLYLQQYPQPDIHGFRVANTPPLQVGFAGLAPGQIGVEQINLVVPANQAPGDWPLFYSNANPVHGGNTSPYVLLPVR